MALTKKEQACQHYLAWKGPQDKYISDINDVLRYEAETLVEAEEQVSRITTTLNQIKEKIAFATEQLTFFEERLPFFDKHEEKE
jgi:DNA repair ATPase RecN